MKTSLGIALVAAALLATGAAAPALAHDHDQDHEAHGHHDRGHWKHDHHRHRGWRHERPWERPPGLRIRERHWDRGLHLGWRNWRNRHDHPAYRPHYRPHHRHYYRYREPVWVLPRLRGEHWGLQLFYID